MPNSSRRLVAAKLAHRRFPAATVAPLEQIRRLTFGQSESRPGRLLGVHDITLIEKQPHCMARDAVTPLAHIERVAVFDAIRKSHEPFGLRVNFLKHGDPPTVSGLRS